MTIVLDERTAPRGFAYTHMTIPVSPGRFTLGVSGVDTRRTRADRTAERMSELKISANGQPIAWHRDQVDMYAFHIDVPPGVSSRQRRFHRPHQSPEQLYGR